MSWFALYLFLFLRYSAKQLQHTFLYAFLHSQNPSDCQLKEYPSDFQSQNIRSSGEDKQFWVQVLLVQIKKKKKKPQKGKKKPPITNNLESLPINQGGLYCSLILSLMSFTSCFLLDFWVLQWSHPSVFFIVLCNEISN